MITYDMMDFGVHVRCTHPWTGWRSIQVFQSISKCVQYITRDQWIFVLPRSAMIRDLKEETRDSSNKIISLMSACSRNQPETLQAEDSKACHSMQTDAGFELSV